MSMSSIRANPANVLRYVILPTACDVHVTTSKNDVPAKLRPPPSTRQVCAAGADAVVARKAWGIRGPRRARKRSQSGNVAFGKQNLWAHRLPNEAMTYV